jgi:hypothetical protein
MYNREETKRRGYSGKSKVFFDGREKLAGKDWAKRKKELWIRAGGRCEHMFFVGDGRNPLSTRYARCRAEGVHPHHEIHRSKERNDCISNLLLLCFEHHALKHGKRNPRWASHRRSERLLGVS